MASSLWKRGFPPLLVGSLRTLSTTGTRFHAPASNRKADEEVVSTGTTVCFLCPVRRDGAAMCVTLSAVAACFGRVCRAPPGLPDFLRSNPEGVAHFAAALDDSSLHKVGKLIVEFQRAPPAPSVVVPPNFKVLTLVAMSTALPAVGFGFVDNFLMIIAGDYIDLTIGVTLGISTMAAAGLGNMVSDWGGIGLQGFIEQKLAGKVSYADQAVTGRAVDDTPLVSRLPVLCSFVVVVTSICPCGCLFGV